MQYFKHKNAKLNELGFEKTAGYNVIGSAPESAFGTGVLERAIKQADANKFTDVKGHAPNLHEMILKALDSSGEEKVHGGIDTNFKTAGLKTELQVEDDKLRLNRESRRLNNFQPIELVNLSTHAGEPFKPTDIHLIRLGVVGDA